MFFRKSFNKNLFPITNILVALFLLSAFFMAAQNVMRTFYVADMTALNNLRPQPMDYLWKLSIHQSAFDKNKIRYYADYYEHLLRVFPNLWDTYGLLGYCYYYLNDDPKAIKFFKIAIQRYPDYFWNYYDLAAIYINESRYPEAYEVLQQAVEVDPVNSLKKIGASQFVYMPLLGSNEKEVFGVLVKHMQETYQASFVLMQLLDQARHNKDMEEKLRKLQLNVYAF